MGGENYFDYLNKMEAIGNGTFTFSYPELNPAVAWSMDSHDHQLEQYRWDGREDVEHGK